jgi:methionyl-tRNA formyltransferase
MDDGADSGDILSQTPINVSYEDDARSLYNKIATTAESQLEKLHDKLKCRKFTRSKQDDRQANYWRKRGEHDGVIRFNMSSTAIYNLVRALSKPYIGAHLIYDSNKVTIWKVKEMPCEVSNIEFGKILAVPDNSIDIKCYDGSIRILEHEFNTLPKVGEYI